jgi:hypothetical protein
MSTYKLNVLFDGKADLQTIYTANQRVTLMKQTEPGQQLAWVAFDPFMNNVVEWTDTYALYAAKGEMIGGGTIQPLSTTQASPQKVYTFSQGAFGDGEASSELSPGQYKVVNGFTSADWLTFGLAQAATVNGTAHTNRPVNAVVVPREQSAVFTPHGQIEVTLRKAAYDSLIVSEVASQPLILTYGNGVSEHTIRYDSTSGRFVPVS